MAVSRLCQCRTLISSLPSPRHRARALHSRAVSSAASDPTGLVDWVRQNGGLVNGVSVTSQSGDVSLGFSLVATEACVAGQALVQLPPRCQLTIDAAADERLLRLVDQVPEELWGAKLALQLLLHRALGKSSPFATYLSSLPVGVPGIPIFYGAEAIAALQYPPVSEQVKRRCRWLASFAREQLSGLPGSPQDPFGGQLVDANALGWAMACVTSRAFRVAGPSKPASLLPLVDMCNHSFQPAAHLVPGPDGSMLLRALQPLAPRQPVLINYGALSADFLLMDYGFVLPGNPSDRIQIRWDLGILQAAGVSLVDGSRAAGWQQLLLGDLRLQGPGADLEVSVGRQPLLDPRLLAGVRILSASSAAELRGRSAQDLGDINAPLSLLVEARALKALVQLLSLVLGSFPTTAAEDAAALITLAPAASDVRLAILFRLEKKRALVDAIRALAVRIKELPSTSPTATLSDAKKRSVRNGGSSNRKQVNRSGKGFG